jgi:hypothetical protein
MGEEQQKITPLNFTLEVLHFSYRSLLDIVWNATSAISLAANSAENIIMIVTVIDIPLTSE